MTVSRISWFSIRRIKNGWTYVTYKMTQRQKVWAEKPPVGLRGHAKALDHGEALQELKY